MSFDRTNCEGPMQAANLETYPQLEMELQHSEHSSLESPTYGVSLQDLKQIQEWNKRPPTSVNSSLHDLIHQRALHQPDDIAICAWDGQMTYAEFDSSTSQLACWLVQQGVKSEERIPLCFEKSKWAIIAMIGILKAGAAFVPLDFSQPVHRLNEMIEALESRFIAASKFTGQILQKSNASSTLLIIDQALQESFPEYVEANLISVCFDQIAFVMFTSGSTGRPSAVVIQHSAMATAAHAYAAEFGFCSQSRIIQFTAFIWLPCTVEIICTLMFGGRICIPSEEERVNDAPKFMRDHGVNIAVLTPSFLGSMTPQDVPDLMVLGLGGERVSQEVVNRWATSVKLVLAYGSTETNISMLQTIDPGPFKYMVGCATNAALWIVDLQDPAKLAPIGEEGELVVESWSLAKEYLGEPEKSAAKFLETAPWLPHLRPKGSARLCRVGDLARYTPDGRVMVLGRSDGVVKIRGQRVQPSDVEHILKQNLLETLQCAVEAVQLADNEDSLRLVAFLAEKLFPPGEAVEISILRGHGYLSSVVQQVENQLLELLPQYMMPSYFIPLNGLPLTANGKIDHQRLRGFARRQSIEDITDVVAEEKRPARTQVEIALCKLWSDVLHIHSEDIGLNDNFFRLGGDSLKSIQLVARCRKESIHLTVETIFKNPRLHDLALKARTLTTGSNHLDMINGDSEYKSFDLVGNKELVKDLLSEIGGQYNIWESMIDDIYPSTSLQAGLLSLTQKQPGAYIVRITLHLPASIDLVHFKHAWESVVQQNSILRTRLVQTSLGVMQVVMREQIEWLSHHSLEVYTKENHNITVKPGDRLTRYAIIDDLSDGQFFVWTAHHSIVDAWSCQKMLRLLEAAYLKMAVPLDLCPTRSEKEPSTTSYKKFIKYLSSLCRETQNEYWRGQLSGAIISPFPRLPSTNYEPIATNICKKKIFFQRKVASHITSATIIRAAWALVLGIYSSTNDVIFGTTLNGRTLPVPGIEDILGPTIATLPVRISIEDDSSVPAFLQVVQNQALDMMAFEQLGLQNIRLLSKEIQEATNFQTLLVTQTSTMEESLRFLDNQATFGSSWESSSTYALNMECTLVEDGAICDATFDGNVIHENEISSLLYLFEHIILQLCQEDPSLRIQDLDLLSSHDTDQIFEWNKSIPETIEACAHELFHAKALLQPDSIAVDAWDGPWTYYKLDQEATKLAHYLVEFENIQPDDIIPICFEKSKWTILAMLAIWKAGGAFAPIDARHPDLWIEKISKNAASKVVLMSELRSTNFQSITKRLVITDEFLNRLPDHGMTPVETIVSPGNLCYVIHTSGSTGIPKGICHEHRSFVSGTMKRIPYLFRSPGSKIIQFSSYSFDVSMEDIWTTLLAGATVCVPSDYERDNDLIGYINRAQITHADITPSLARTLRPELIPTVKVLILSGEHSTVADRKIWVGSTVVLDQYGPSEISITSHSRQVTESTDFGDVGTSIGCLGWIVDKSDHNKLQPIGAAGELLIEGPILSRGYLNQKPETSNAYIENPSWLPVKTHGARRFFKTGDLARLSWDGSLRILGRIDSQVKIRGQRVDILGIEHEVREALGSNLSIAVDLINLLGTQTKQKLIVFVALPITPRSSTEPTPYSKSSKGNQRAILESIADNLYSKLCQVLPVYMIPSALVSVESIPINISGKVDRKRLKEIAASLQEDRAVFLSPARNRVEGRKIPSTEMEILLQRLWAKTLDIPIEDIHADDNFLAIGGDSVLAMKMVAMAAREQKRIAFTVQDIFRYPKLSDLAHIAIANAGGLVIDDNTSDKRHVGKLGEAVQPFEMLGDAESLDISSLKHDIGAFCRVDPSIINDIYPCSPLQEGIMAVSVKNSGFYVSQFVLDLPQDIDIERFKLAVGNVSDATPILRTRLVQNGTQMVQVVLSTTTTWSFSIDLDKYLEDDKNVPMGFGDALTRHAIVHQEPRICFVWTMHHALYDGWSLSLILDAFKTAYKGKCFWRPTTEYAQFIQHVSSIDREQNTTYWSSQLSEALHSASCYPRLPSVGYTPRAQSSIEYKMRIPRHPSGEFTVATLVRSAWAVLVSKYSESNDVIFGATLAGRDIPIRSIEEVIGPVFTTVPIRIKLNYNASIVEFLKEVQDQNTELTEFQHFGLQNIRELNPDCQMACSFCTLIVVQPSERLEFEDEIFPTNGIARDLSQYNSYPVMIQFTPHGEEMIINVNFDSNIIDELQMQRNLKQFETVTYQMCHGTIDAKLHDLEMITSSDIQDIATWNREAIDPIMSCIHHVIKKQVIAQPESLAVTSWDGELTYIKLDKLSTQLSHHLFKMGIGPEIMVPVCFEKSMWAVVALLAVLKAGGAFVLMDPSHPMERLRSIIHDTGARVVLSSLSCRNWLESSVEAVIAISDAFIASLPDHSADPISNVQPGNLACLVFTSGSSGNPKGIMLEHSAICTSIAGHGPALNIGRNTRTFQFSSYSFDMAVYDIITSLAMGALICMPSEDDRMNNLIGIMNTMMVNWAFFTPSTIKLLRYTDVPTLQTLVVGGEAVSQEIVDNWTHIRLIQCSGPAETTTCIMGNMTRATNKACIGRGVNAHCWIVDPYNHNILASIGTVGELVIEGPTLARGYLNKPSDSWIENPAWIAGHLTNFSTQKARRMYKCGDLVRYNSDGSIIFVGRKDSQIKLRGQRIELTEIEDHLRAKLSNYQVAAEMIVIEGNQNHVLAAFVANKQFENSSLSGDIPIVYGTIPLEMEAHIEGMDSYLAQFLPHYMIPTVVIPLTKLPLNGSGKINRKSLRQLGSGLTIQQFSQFSSKNRVQRMPSTDAERKMQVLWAEVLKIDQAQIAADDKFFNLGADSITAMKLVAVARQHGISLTVASIFKTPTLCDMASMSTVIKEVGRDLKLKPFDLLGDFLETNQILDEITSDWSIPSEMITDAYPCTPLQQGLMALSIERDKAYISQEVFTFPSWIEIDRFKAACESVAAASSILRTRIVQLRSSLMLQVVVQEDLNWFESFNLDDYLEKDIAVPMQLGCPLTRWAIVHSEIPYFVWTKHHSSYDGFTLTLLLRLIENAYNATDMGPLTPSLRPDFNEFIKYILNKKDKANTDFWRHYFAGAICTSFPCHRDWASRVANPRESVSRNILFKKPSKSSITMSTILRASWAILLSRYVGSSDVTFGVTLSGRNADVPGIESILGPTFTTVPVRVFLEGDKMSVQQYLQQVQDQAISIIPYEHDGLLFIKQSSPEARDACDFRSLLVIQPMSDRLGNSILIPQRAANQATFRTYPLTLECRLIRSGMELTLHFDPEMIETAQIRRLAGHFEQVLQQLLRADQNPQHGKMLNEITMMTPEDRTEIWNWNEKLPSRENCCVHELIQKQMEMQPHSEAVSAWDGNLSYAELDGMSARLADHLVQLGVGPDDLVPILFEKSKWTIVSILGILRAGGAFVPLDPSHPPARLQSLIQRVGARCVLSSAENERLCLEINVKVFVLQQNSMNSLPTTSAWKDRITSPNGILYVGFTSGSSGVPKAVTIEHSAYCSGAAAHIQKIAIDKTSRVLQFASHSFDTFFEDVLTTLIVGACIVVPSEFDRTSDITGVINKMRVNFAHLTPSFSNLIEPENVPSLRVLLLGGEAMTSFHVRRWAHRLHLINVYGPSECCVTCSVNSMVDDSPNGVNIGNPVGCVGWITDIQDHNILCPIGVVGELLIEGPLLARGYLDDPERTASAFIAAPEWLKQGNINQPGRHSRLYKTGDLVYYGPGGKMSYVGRKDSQVKLRGQRIELGEIEYHIRNCLLDEHVTIAVEVIYAGGVEALAVFMSRDDIVLNRPTEIVSDENDAASAMNILQGDDEKDLPTTVSSREQFRRITEKLSEQLLVSLPAYMIPSFFIPLPQMPSTISKKVDRGTLKKIASNMTAEELTRCAARMGDHRGPRTALERQIRLIWSQVLNMPLAKIALNISFLAIGGDSISAMQLLSRYRKANIQATLNDVLHFKTIAAFCAHAEAVFNGHRIKQISEIPDGRLERDLTAIQGYQRGNLPTLIGTAEDRIDTSFPLSPIQSRFFDLYPTGNNTYQLSHLLRLNKWVKDEHLLSALKTVVRVHSMLRARFEYDSQTSKWEQRVTSDVNGSFRLQHSTKDNLGSLDDAITKSCNLIDIAQGPVMVVNLITTPQDQVLFLTAHHLVLDLVSWRIILRDLEELLQSDSSDPFMQKTLSYQSWCQAQDEYAQTQLDPSDTLPFAVNPVPLDYWGISDVNLVLKSNYVSKRVFLDEKLTSSFLEGSGKLNTKPINMLLSAIIYSFRLIFPDREPATIFNVSHGRHPWDDSHDLSRTVGWFTTMYPVQIPGGAVQNYTTTLCHLHDVHDRIPGHGLPYFASRYLNAQGRKLSGSHYPMEVVFNYAGLYQQLERKEALFQELRVANKDASDQRQEIKHDALIEIVSRVQEGRLGFGVSFSRDLLHQEKIEMWVAEMQRQLENIGRSLVSEVVQEDIPVAVRPALFL